MPEPVPGIEQRLAAAEATIEALHRGDADSVADAAEAALASLQNTAAALRASVSRYDTLLRFIDRGFCVVEMIFDASGEAVDYRFLETNPAFEAQTGIVGAAGRRMREIAPEHEPIWFERYGRVARTGEPAQFESVAKALGRVYEVYAYRVDEPAQAHVAILFKDITERARDAERRRQSADALQRSEERWNAALEHFGEGAIIADDHDELIYWNPAARRIHCMTEVADGLGPLASMPFELWSADGARRLERSEWPIPRIRRGETIDRLELRLRPAAQHWERIVSYSGARVSMPSGEGLVFLSVHDLTEQRMAEGALRDSEMRFRRLADAMPQLVWTATADGTVDYYNTQVTRYTGLSENDDGTWNWHPSLHPDDEDRTVRAWRHAVANGGTYECEHRMRMSDGHFRWHLSRAHRVGPAGARQWFGTATDVHDLKIAQERLTAADRRKDDFLAVLAHELRNPLAPLRNGLEVLRRDPSGNERARRTREMMQRQVDQMVRLLDDLLDTSRISRGKLELHREPVDLAEVVRNALETSRPLLDAGNHEVQVDLPARPLLVHVDPIRVTQVLTNLLNNAAHYNAPAGRIGVSLRGEAGGEAIIVVEDEGFGIPPDMLEHVFEPFVQLEPVARRGRYGGLGLGLALARSIVELHGGSIRASAGRSGRGSALEVRLPIGPKAVAADASQAVPRRAAAARRVLVVDDNRDAGESLGALLQLLGHQVRLAHDGAAALEAVARDAPDIVLLDLGMPGMDGYEVARRIGALPGRAALSVVALSGFGQAADRCRSAQGGFDAHLVKPVEIEVLEALLAHPPRKSTEAH
ncbi:MAG TPA: ATP-binding protein [Steroidobacteraceae bacterium]|nr:ATP-binding protein [Steroidobacteraceae bacterium]